MLKQFTSISKKLLLHAKNNNNCQLLTSYCCYSTNLLKFSHLEHRAVLQLTGKETVDFLQGLITNDLHQLVEDKTMQAMYAMMLNTQGRVEHDLIVSQCKDGLLIDCNLSTVEQLEKTLKRYRMRKKVNIKLREDLEVWQGFDSNGIDKGMMDVLRSSCETLTCFSDPRIDSMGIRILAECNSTALENNNVSLEVYHDHRYSLGIPEGHDDLPPGKALPLESNLDLMNGVCFSKGCYIGQELTARTHFTGVVRKRLIPFEVKREEGDGVKVGDKLYASSEAKKSAGKVVSLRGGVGLGLIRLSYLSKEPLVTKANCKLKCTKPKWWPEKLPSP